MLVFYNNWRRAVDQPVQAFIGHKRAVIEMSAYAFVALPTALLSIRGDKVKIGANILTVGSCQDPTFYIHNRRTYSDDSVKMVYQLLKGSNVHQFCQAVTHFIISFTNGDIPRRGVSPYINQASIV